MKELIDRYYEFLSEGGEPLEPEPLLDKNTGSKPVNEFIFVEEQQILSKAIKDLIAKKQKQYGANNAQKHQPFSTNSRSWDDFKEFAASAAEISLWELDD